MKLYRILEDRGGLITKLKNTPCKGPFHPEENRMEHVDIIMGRYLQSHNFSAVKHSLSERDLNTMRIAIWFHDLGCIHCTKYNESKMSYTAYGHEKISFALMEGFKDVIEEYGADYDRARWLVLNHMKAHFYASGIMTKPAKVSALTEHPDFHMLMWLEKMDDMMLDFDGEVHC